MTLSLAHPVGGACAPDAADRESRLNARIVICLALVLEVQAPRLGNFRLTVAAFAFGAALLLFVRMRQAVQNFDVMTRGPMLFLTLYCVWCMTTIAWSATPFDTVFDSGLLIVTLLLAASYAYVDVRIFAEEFVKISVCLAVLSWMMAAAVPRIAVLPDLVWRLNGPMQHPQRLALVMGAAMVTLVTMKLYHRTWPASAPTTAAVFVVLAATLLATQTRAFTAFAFAVVCLLMFMRAATWLKLIASTVALLVIWWSVANFDLLMGAISRDGSNTLTLTGRTVIWERSLDLIRENPVLGYGFGSFRSDLTQYFFASGYLAPHAHNTWINATFETGIVGAVLLTGFMLAALRCGIARRPSVGSALILFAVLCGATGLVFGGKVSTLWVIGAVMVAQEVAQRHPRPT